METPPIATPREPNYRLFDSGAVGTAAFFCCPLAGAILIAINYFRLGKAGRGVFALTLGLIATTLNILIRWHWNTTAGSLDRLKFDAFEFLFLGVAWLCTWQVAKEEQGEIIKEHLARGGQLVSRWTAVWVGLATLAVLFGVICAALYETRSHRAVIIGTKDQVIYSGIATKTEATALGEELRSEDYFLDRGATVLLNKGFGSTTISFAVQDGIWNQPGTLSSFEELALELAPAIGGLPVQVRLVDSKLDVQATSTVGEVSFSGGDGVYYEGQATKAQAQAIGRRFESMGFFRGKGANVFLIRHDGGTILAFVVVGDAWNVPHRISTFEAIVRDVAALAGVRRSTCIS